MNAVGYLLLCLSMFALVGWLLRRHYVKARELLQAWADGNGYKILHATRPLFVPFNVPLGATKYQVVYHVAVYDDAVKRIRSAWVRLGTYWTGSMEADAIKVVWEHES